MPTMTGEIKSMRKDRKGVKMEDGEWYSAFNASQMGSAEWKDTVTFEYIEKGPYKNIKGNVTVTGAASGATSVAGSTSAPYRGNAGVEVGHAWNSAVQIVLASNPNMSYEDIVKECIPVAARVYAVCAALREKAAAGTLDGTAPVASAAQEPEPEPKATTSPLGAVDIEAITGAA